MFWKTNPRGRTSFRVHVDQQPQPYFSGSLLALCSFHVGFVVGLTVKGHSLPRPHGWGNDCQRTREAVTTQSSHRIIRRTSAGFQIKCWFNLVENTWSKTNYSHRVKTALIMIRSVPGRSPRRNGANGVIYTHTHTHTHDYLVRWLNTIAYPSWHMKLTITT